MEGIKECHQAKKGKTFKGKVNGCHKNISLRNIFRNFLWEIKKITNFFYNFYISHKSGIKIFLK